MSKLRITCDCPDFQKSATFIINTQAFSKSYTRSWKDSGAGIDPGQYCKHCWATLRVRGEITPDMIPTDVPIPITRPGEEEEGRVKEIYQPGYLGHSFSPRGGNNSFGIPKLRPHRGA